MAKRVSRPRPKPKPRREEVLFAAYLTTRKVLIVDPAQESRSGIAKMLQGLGAPGNNILLAQDFDSAQKLIKKENPEFVISEYHLGPQYGLDLMFSMNRGHWPVRPTLFVLMTADKDASLLAQAAEEAVDAYLLKPFSRKAFREHLIQAFYGKVEPGPYRQTIEDGKRLMGQRRLEAARETFLSAIALDPRPALAYYYLGRTSIMAKDYDQAEDAFRMGLKIDPHHYKCLTGFLTLYLRQKRSLEAYDIGRQLLRHFPISPARLDFMIRLAIRNQMFVDIEVYYEFFARMGMHTPELIRCMEAALIVGGKYLLKNGEKKRARTLFENAVSVSIRSPQILRQAITALLEAGEFAMADEFLRMFPVSKRGGEGYLILDFLVTNATGSLDQIVQLGRRILKEGVRDSQVYEILIHRSVEARLHRSAESLVYEAMGFWPDEKERFLSLLQQS